MRRAKGAGGRWFVRTADIMGGRPNAYPGTSGHRILKNMKLTHKGKSGRWKSGKVESRPAAPTASEPANALRDQRGVLSAGVLAYDLEVVGVHAKPWESRFVKACQALSDYKILNYRDEAPRTNNLQFW